MSEIIVNNRGFDYAKTPSVTISGGNGSGAVCEAKMRGFTHKASFTDFDVSLAADTFNGEHKFLNGEEVTYTATGTPIGIGVTNVGFTTNRLLSGSTYFVSKRSNTSFALNINKNDAIAGINTIYFIQNGNGTHTFKSKKIRQVIDRIVVTLSLIHI